jgi:arylsulfatase A-like enzyme
MKDNYHAFDANKTTFPQLLQQKGYQTAMIGKWHLQSYPKGFDYWKILPGQGLYYDPRLIGMSGDTQTYKGYATEIITDEAINWLKNRNPAKPFMMLYHHKAPHRNFVPLLKYAEKFSKTLFPEPATLAQDPSQFGKARGMQKMSILLDMTLCSDLKVNPAQLKNLPGFKYDSSDARNYYATINRIPEPDRTALVKIFEERGELVRKYHQNPKMMLKLKYQWYMRDYLACVASVDENVGKLLDYLDQHQLTNNTLVVYTSDQGFYLGENGWFDKRWMYDVSMKSPLLMRWPGHIKPGSQSSELVQNIDFAPTFLEVAGCEIPSWMQGISLKKHIEGKQKKLDRQELYYHYYEFPADHSVLPHLGIRNQQYKLIYFYTIDEWELYNMKKDPDEQVNLYANPTLRKTIDYLRTRLIELRQQYQDHEPAGSLK